MPNLSRRQVLELVAAGTAGMLGVPRSSAMGRADPGVVDPRRPVGFLRTNWSQDPYAFGSYSFRSRRSPGTGEQDRALVEAPVDGRIFFAGEALNPKYASTVHAAHESGLRAVRSISAVSPRRVAVVGAGMAGLTAASALAKARVHVTVLEARGRIGGRIETVDRLGMNADLGASWIHGPRGNPLSEMADALGLDRVATDETFVIRGDGGRRVGFLGTPSWLDDVVESTSFGVDLGELNAAYLEQVYAQHGDGYPGGDVKVVDGFASLLEALSGDYEVRLGAAVARIELADAGVDVSVRDGASERFDAVLVTVPLGVLKAGSIVFDPELSPEKRGAIERMGMGLLDKLYLRFEHVFWDEQTTILTPENGLRRGQFNYWINLHRYYGVPVLLALNGGAAARALASRADDEVVELAVRTLRSAYPTG